MLVKCSKCGEVIDTATLKPVVLSHVPVDQQTKKPIDVSKETEIISGQPDIAKAVKQPEVKKVEAAQ